MSFCCWDLNIKSSQILLISKGICWIVQSKIINDSVTASFEQSCKIENEDQLNNNRKIMWYLRWFIRYQREFFTTYIFSSSLFSFCFYMLMLWNVDSHFSPSSLLSLSFYFQSLERDTVFNWMIYFNVAESLAFNLTDFQPRTILLPGEFFLSSYFICVAELELLQGNGRLLRVL